MSLEFLSKKSWHTKNLGNQEKVWIAEQRAIQEESRVQELQRQIQLDREQEEMNRITGQDKKRGSIDKGIDWMYSEGGGMKTAEDLNEEFLLGKKFTNRDFLQQEATTSNNTTKQHEGTMDIILDSVAENPLLSSLNSSGTQKNFLSNEKNQVQRDTNDEDDAMARNREFHLRYEDPMYMVSMRRKEIENKLQKKKELLERVSGKKALMIAKRDENHRILGQDANYEKLTDQQDRPPREDCGRGRSANSPSKEGRMKRRRSGQKKKKHRSCFREETLSDHGSSGSSIDSRDRHKRRRHRGKKHRLRKDDDGSDSGSSGDRHKKHWRREVRHRKKRCHKRHHDSHSDSSVTPSCYNRYNDYQQKTHVRDSFEQEKKAARYDSNGHNISSSQNAFQEEMNVTKISTTTLEPDRVARKASGFGLQNVPLKGGLDSLGPSKEVLERKRKEREASLEKKRPASKIQAITAEERTLLLAKMQSDAEARKSSLGKILQQQHDDQ